MKFFLDFGNLLHNNWDLFSTHPMLFVLYGVLVAAITRSFVKNNLNLELLSEKNTLEDGFRREREKNKGLKEESRKLQIQLEDRLHREREKNSKLEGENRRLMELSRKLKVQTEEQSKLLSELGRENLKLHQDIERLEKVIKLDVERVLLEAQITKRTGQGDVLRVEREKKQQLLPSGPEKIYQDTYQRIQQEIYRKLMEDTERARNRL